MNSYSSTQIIIIKLNQDLRRMNWYSRIQTVNSEIIILNSNEDQDHDLESEQDSNNSSEQDHDLES
jgi:hypothetical protein